MKKCAQCHGKLGLGVRSRNLWNGRWWVHVRYCSTHCQARSDPPPLKWSDLRYVFDIKEDCNGKEALQARRDRREAAPGRCSGLAGPGHDGGDPADRCERGDLLSLASRVWRAED